MLRKSVMKSESKPTEAERRMGAKILIFLGGTWLLAGLFMRSVLDDFMPFGGAWFIMSTAFMLWGTYILGATRKKTESLVPQPAVIKPPVEPKTEILWLIVNRLFTTIPFTSAEGIIRLYKNREDAEAYVKNDTKYQLTAMTIRTNQLELCKDLWAQMGIKSYEIYSDYENCICEKVNETNFIGDRTALLALRIKQNSLSGYNKSLLELKYDLLKRELNTTPLLVPMAYDNDKEDLMSSDTAIHMTDRANRLLSNLLYDNDGGPKNPIPTYFGIKDHTGERLAVMWNGARVLYYGGAETISADIADEQPAEIPRNFPKVMHCYFADNTTTGSHMLAAFTNIKDLRKIYSGKRIALFTFSELAALAKGSDGIVINPGPAGVSLEIGPETINKLM